MFLQEKLYPEGNVTKSESEKTPSTKSEKNEPVKEIIDPEYKINDKLSAQEAQLALDMENEKKEEKELSHLSRKHYRHHHHKNHRHHHRNHRRHHHRRHFNDNDDEDKEEKEIEAKEKV